MEIIDERKRRVIGWGLMPLSLPLMTFAAYFKVLGYGFVEPDTLPLIEISRLSGWGDLWRIMSSNLLGDYYVGGWFFRPVANLSYSLDYIVWGLNPFGYHLTDIILQSIAVLLVFYLFKRLFDGRVFTAWLGAAIFALHPVLFEAVPASGRRHDILAMVFFLAAFIFFLRYREAKRRRPLLLTISLCLFFLALGSKEIAMILPALIFIQAFFYPEPGSVRSGRFLKTLKLCYPYLLVAYFFFIWRGWVVSGLGGYVKPFSYIFGQSTLQYSLNTVFVYFANLAGLGYFADRIINGLPETILMYTYLFFITAGLLLIAYCCFFVTLKITPVLKKILILGAWLLLPLIISLAAQAFDFRYLYFPAVPFSGLLALLAVNCSERLKMTFNTGLGKGTGIRWWYLPIYTVGIIFTFFFITVSLTSVGHFQEWEDCSQFTNNFLQGFSDAVEDIPDGSVIYVPSIPSISTGSYADFTHQRSITYPRYHTIYAWLHLNNPARDITLNVEPPIPVSERPQGPRMALEKIDDLDYRMVVEY